MRRTILVVEDDQGRRKALVELLSAAGYDVIAGDDFQAALGMVDRLGVDVMISDLKLSSGAQQGQAGRRGHAALKHLFLSRVPVPNGRAAAPAGDILPAPLDRTALLDKLRALLAT
jgi:DNA-binding response OmpR family regulator